MAKIQINPAPFKDAIALKNSIEREIKLGGINTDTFKGKTIEETLRMDLAPFINILAAIDSSSEVNAAIMTCLERCTYNGEKITENTFNDVKAWEDYYPIVIDCLKVNLTPFLKGLASYLTTKLNQNLVPTK